MKKYILSTLVILTFATYVLFQKITGINTTTVSKSDNKTNVSETFGKISNALYNISTTLNKSGSTGSNSTPVKSAKTTAVTISGLYKDGEYIGDSVDTYYGNILVKATISGGKLADVQFLDYPQSRNTSIEINNYAMPILRSEAIQSQSASVDIVSGASHSSGAFIKSLQTALSQAKNS